MVAFTYIAKKSGGDWKASRVSSEDGPELSADASDTYALQKELKKISIENAAGGGVQTILSTIDKNTLVFQVIVGGAVFASGGGGGGAAAAASSGPAAAEAKKEEKKEESEEEEDEDMGFSLFD